MKYLFSKLADAEYTLLVIKDDMDHIFGAFCTEAWKESNDFSGTGESFVFTFRQGDDLELSATTGLDENYQMADRDGLIIGGGNKNEHTRAAITIMNNF